MAAGDTHEDHDPSSSKVEPDDQVLVRIIEEIGKRPAAAQLALQRLLQELMRPPAGPPGFGGPGLMAARDPIVYYKASGGGYQLDDEFLLQFLKRPAAQLALQELIEDTYQRLKE